MMNAPTYNMMSLFNNDMMLTTEAPPESQQLLRSSSPSNVSVNTTSSPSSSTFPMKLHAMLSESALLGFDDVICWLPGGHAFKVLDPKRFSEEIMPRYFSQTKYKSFQRQLNIYGFQRVHHGPHKGGYAHKFFIQGVADLCERIKREASPSQAPSTIAAVTTPTRPPAVAQHKRVISFDARDRFLPADLLAPVTDFSWDVDTEGTFGDNNNSNVDSFESTIDDIAAFATSMAQGNDHNNTGIMTFDPTPLPFSANSRPEPVMKRESSACILDNEDVAFFKNLFQPGDAASEKEILESFMMEEQQPQQQQPVPPSPQMHYASAPMMQQQQPIAASMPMPAQPAQQQQAPLMSAGAVSEYNFPRKLYRLLMDCESNPDYHSIVSWSLDGKSFKVHDKKRFVSVILPNYFDQTQYASFRRQLNMYSFLRQSMSTYANPFFMRGNRELIDNVVRKNNSNNSNKKE